MYNMFSFSLGVGTYVRQICIRARNKAYALL